MQTWSFDNDTLFDLVKSGRKTATCSLYHSDLDLPKIGELSIIENSNGEKIMIKLINVSICRFYDIDYMWAAKEGEGDLSLEYWRHIHREFFAKQCIVHGQEFNEDIKLVCEEFCITK